MKKWQVKLVKYSFNAVAIPLGVIVILGDGIIKLVMTFSTGQFWGVVVANTLMWKFLIGLANEEIDKMVEGE